ncbi:MAG: hypothetical protein ACYC3S_00480 [Chloroflexota bacterium]
MGVLDDPTLFYAPPQDDWAQGDIVVVPTAVLWASGERPAAVYSQPAPPPDGSSSVVYDLWAGDGLLPAPAVECWLGPAVVVSDDCAIDKEFNARVDELLAAGRAEAEAIEVARQDESLDRTLLVAPVLPYGQLRFTSEGAVRTAQAVGYFPIVNGPEMDEGYVDLGRIVPVSRQLLFGPVASLSEGARSILRWKVAQYCAARNLSVDAEISAAVGRTITRVQAVEDSKRRLVVDLELDGGAARLRLRQEPRRGEVPPARGRSR